MTGSELSNELRAFLPNIVASEVLAAHAGLKVVRTGLKRTKAIRLMHLGRCAGFHVIVGDDECFPRRDRGKGGWCNGLREGRVSGTGYFNVYVAKTPSIAYHARDAEADGDDDAFAHFLGTPMCCRRFYDLVKEAAASEQNDFLPFSAPKAFTDPASAFLNIGAQYFDAALISHFPCSLSCQRSIELARERARLLLKHDRVWLEQTIELLNHATLYTEYLGVFLLRAAKTMDRHGLRFDRRRVRGTSRSKIFSALAKGSSIILTSNGVLEIKSSIRQWTFRPKNPRLFLPTPISLDYL